MGKDGTGCSSSYVEIRYQRCCCSELRAENDRFRKALEKIKYNVYLNSPYEVCVKDLREVASVAKQALARPDDKQKEQES